MLNWFCDEPEIDFTLPPCLNFQRSSPAMWQAALKTYEEREKIQRDLLKHKLALQKNKHTDIWIGICKTLNHYFDNSPIKLLQTGNFDVPQILQIIQKDKKQHFPYLSGPKMANYWLYILSRYTNVKLTNMQRISIIPDTHVIQCTIKLGMVNHEESPEIIAKLWDELLQGSKIFPVEMHPVLWNWSRNNFKPEV